MTDQERMIAQITETWAYHPKWKIGRLLSSAASISRAELRINPLHVSDDEILAGLKALIPDVDPETGKPL